MDGVRADARARRLETTQVLGIASKRDGRVLTTLVTADDDPAADRPPRRAKAWMWVTRHVVAVLLVGLGIVLTLATAG